MTTPDYEALTKAGLDKVAAAAGIEPTGTVTVKAGGDMVQVDSATGAVITADPTVTA